MIEDIYNKLKDRNLGMQINCDRKKIELGQNNLRIDISKRQHSHSHATVMVETKKKCKFSGFFTLENSFNWHVPDEKNINGLIHRIKKIQEAAADPDGPFGFSKRSTYIKRINNEAHALSGNFVAIATVKKMVVIDNTGLVSNNLASPNQDPWFLIDIRSDKDQMQYSAPMLILYNLENWWPCRQTEGGFANMDKETYATSILSSTVGRLLTMHDKFVIDLAIKIFNETSCGTHVVGG